MRRSICIALWALVACSSARPAPTVASAPAAPVDAGTVLSPTAEADLVWARRDTEPLALEHALKLYEDASQKELEPSGAYLGVARARRVLAERALRDATAGNGEALQRAAQESQACAAAAHRSWSIAYPAAGAQLDGTHPAAEVYAQVDAGGAEAMYLEAVCSALWSRTQGFTPLIERHAELEAELARVAQLAPQLDGAGPMRELGALLAALPTYAGGNLDEARAQLEKAIQAAPDDARNRLVIARTVAVKAQDRELFVTQLRKVAESQDKAAAAEAGELLARTDELFGPAEAAQPVPGGTQK